METVELNLARVPVSVARARAGMRPLREALGGVYEGNSTHVWFEIDLGA